MIAQAVNDYRSFEEKKWIVGGVVKLPFFCESIKSKKNKRSRGILARRANCEELLHFFKKSGAMDRWIDMAGIDISPDQIRSKLGIDTKNDTVHPSRHLHIHDRIFFRSVDGSLATR